ncbi:MAG: hypothetical protein VCB07_00730 [Gammaproteobacteria bacterium]
MAFDLFTEGLTEMYQGEMLGVAIFDRMLPFFDDPVEHYKVATMLQLETETVARLRPTMLALGLDLAEKGDPGSLGQRVADNLKGLKWDELMLQLRDLVKPYVERYSEIVKIAPEKYRSIAESMVVHEESLYRFAELELIGDSEHSLDDVIAQLHHPLPRP